MFPSRILLAADDSKDARHAARDAAELSLKLDSELHAVYVAPEYPYVYASHGVARREEENRYRHEDRQILDRCVENIRAVGGTVTGSHLGAGDAASEIVELAEELGVGLVVLGSRGPLRRALMGSVSTGVLRHAHCPVMVVRQEKER